MGFENTGRVWTVESLRSYLEGLKPPAWCDSVTMHHTWSPTLAQRPHGFTAQHLENIQNYYRQTLGWSTGPHLFADDDQLWGMCDFRKKGAHAKSFNSRSIGIEVLGNYDTESPGSGRGLACWTTGAAAAKVLLDWIGKKPSASTVLFHREDPKTSKSCPGTRVQKDWVLSLIKKPTPVATAEKPPLKPATSVALSSRQLRLERMAWFAPAHVFLAKKGFSYSEISSRLKKRGKYFYFGDTLLEDAFYDTEGNQTWVSLRDLEAINLV